MEIKKAGIEDIELLAENRLEFISLIRTVDDRDELYKQTMAYLQRHINDGTMLSYVAIDEGKIASSCILCLYEAMPTRSCLSGIYGLLLNVYTIKDYRNKGLSYNLLTRIIKDARQIGVGKIQLTYTDDGYPLYKKLGFEKNDREMSLKL
jgi:Acetyltransferase (GNAT) family.